MQIKSRVSQKKLHFFAYIKKKYYLCRRKDLQMKRITSILLGICLCTIVSAQRVSVPQMSPEEQNEALYAIGSIVLQDGFLYLKDKAGNVLYSEPLNTVRAIVLNHDQPTALPENQVKLLVAYPNPTTSMLYIDGVDDDTTWRVFDLQGQLITVGKGNQVPVDHLAQGNYLLQVKTNIIKFIKQ